MSRIAVVLSVAIVIVGLADDGPAALFSEAQTTEAAGNWPAAAKLYRKILASKLDAKNKSKALLGLAECGLHLNKVEDATAALTRLFTECPSETDQLSKAAATLLKARRVLDRREQYTRRDIPVPFSVEIPGAKASPLRAKLKSIVIKQLELKDELLPAAFEKLSELSKKRDPKGQGVRFVLHMSPDPLPPVAQDTDDEADGGFTDDDDDFGDDDDDVAQEPKPHPKPRECRVRMTLTNIPLLDALRHICEQGAARYRIDSHAVTVFGWNVEPDPFEVRFYSIDPQMLTDADGEISDCQKLFSKMGVTFGVNLQGKRAAISYGQGTCKLTSLNTRSNQKLIEQILREGAPRQPQAVIWAELVELKEQPESFKKFDGLPTAEMIQALPVRCKRMLSRIQLIGRSGNEVSAEDRRTGVLAGQKRQLQFVLKCTPQVHVDHSCVSLDIDWRARGFADVEELARNEAEEGGPEPAWLKKLNTKFTIEGGHAIVNRLTSAEGNEGKPLYLIIGAEVVGRDGLPLSPGAGSGAQAQRDALRLLLEDPPAK